MKSLNKTEEISVQPKLLLDQLICDIILIKYLRKKKNFLQLPCLVSSFQVVKDSFFATVSMLLRDDLEL